MTQAAGHAEPTDPPVLHAAVALAADIRAASKEIERERRLPQRIVQALRRADVFAMAMPLAWGGPELDPLTQFRVIETLAMADGSVGWCAMINCDSGYVSAFLDQDIARRMYSDIQVAVAVSATPAGQATRVAGGYRISGRFPFASGSQHCEWIWGGCLVVEDGMPRKNANGVPETRHCMLKLSQCEILDTWYTTGLRGTGSNDVLVTDVFVPVEHTFSFQDPGLIKRPGPLYALPLMFTAKASAPALGVARHAIDALIDTAAQKPARRYLIGDDVEPSMSVRDSVFVQDAVGRAEAMLTAARAYQFEVIGDLWKSLIEGRQPTQTQLAHLAVLHTYVMGVCVDVVQLVCKAAGGAAIYQKGPFDRCLRDIMTMNQHAIATLRNYEAAGRLLLGLQPLHWLV